MVESIFGGKATYPLGCYEGNVFHPRLAERRLSVQSSNLKTISETVDDNAAFDGPSNEQEFQNVADKGPTCYRRPRTMSLPAIYRDGSYLRIKQRATITPISCQNRRYSEPAGLATEQIIHRLSQRSSSNDNSSVSMSDESENTSCLRSSVKSVESAYTARRESSFQDLVTPRRHSDPMCYITEHAKKMGISFERRSKSSRKVVPEAVTMLSACGEKPQPRAAKEHSPRIARRRKSSLVPVPFSSPRQDTQKARNNQSFRRPLSFPPSTKESKRHCSLPALNLKPVAFLTGRCVSSENENTAYHCDCNNNQEIQEQTLESEQPKDIEDKYAANEDILLQWMKFFG